MSRWGELIPHSEDDLACLCGCRDEEESPGVEGLTVRKIGYWVNVQLDEDGTPLTMYGDRMVEVRPNEWMDPLGAALMAAWPEPQIIEETE